MGSAIPFRPDFDGPGLRRLARVSKDTGQTRRLLALAVICDGVARGPAHPSTNGPSRPICSARSAQRAASAPDWCYHAAQPRPCSTTSARSRNTSLRAPIGSSCSIRPDGPSRPSSISRQASHCWPRRLAHQSSIGPRISGSSSEKTGYPTGSSPRMTISSIIVAKPGTSSYINPGPSCLSVCENGHMSSNQCRLV